MAVLHNALVFFASLTFLGCSPDYSIVSGGGEKIVEVEVEVPVYVETEVPTDPGLIWIDSFVQPQSVDGVDILWIIDTSGSMNRYEPSLMAGIESMMLALPPSGWRLAMMSNDPSKAKLESQFPLVPGDDAADALTMFNAMGTGHREEGFDSVYEYIINNSYAQTWMRPEAALLVVFVSDEEEQSDEHLIMVEDFINWYGAQRNGSVFLSSIVKKPVDESLCDPPPSIIDVGDRYIEATDHFGGVVVDICEDDWSPGVADASQQIEPYEYIRLTHEPIEDSIRVFVNGALFYDWSYVSTENTIYFSVIPDGNSLVEVGYRYYEMSDTGLNDTAA